MGCRKGVGRLAEGEEQSKVELLNVFLGLVVWCGDGGTWVL